MRVHTECRRLQPGRCSDRLTFRYVVLLFGRSIVGRPVSATTIALQASAFVLAIASEPPDACSIFKVRIGEPGSSEVFCLERLLLRRFFQAQNFLEEDLVLFAGFNLNAAASGAALAEDKVNLALLLSQQGDTSLFLIKFERHTFGGRIGTLQRRSGVTVINADHFDTFEQRSGHGIVRVVRTWTSNTAAG